MIGIVTSRRFLGGVDLDKMSNRATELQEHVRKMAGMGSAVIMGVDFGKFASMMSESLLLVNEVIRANANAGLGIGFQIRTRGLFASHSGESFLLPRRMTPRRSRRSSHFASLSGTGAWPPTRSSLAMTRSRSQIRIDSPRCTHRK